MSKLSPYFTVSSLTKTLFIFAVITGLATAITVGGVRFDAGKTEYSVEPMNQACEPPSDDRTEAGSNDTQLDSDSHEYPDRVLEYSELSPAAQEVFRSALQADGEYTTRTHPDEFELRSDTDNRNYVQYESECYQLIAQTKGGLGTAFAVYLLSIVGGGLTVIFAFASVVSYERDRRRNGGLRQPKSNNDTEHNKCPNCDLTLVMGVENCQRCGWSITNDETEEADIS